jgi:hypothetical protein
VSLATQVAALAARVAAEFKTRDAFHTASSVDQTGFAADTYVTGSGVPTKGRLRVGSKYRLLLHVTKTAAGTATPILTIRFGTAGSTADTARLTFTWTAGTAVADEAMVEVWVTVRAVGASAVLQGIAEMRHRLATTGFNSTASIVPLAATSATFDATSAAAIIGASLNGGTSAAWTVKLVQAELASPSPT